MAIEVKTKKWGSSIGVVLPKEVVEEKGIKENQKILVEVVKKADISKFFGSIKLKMTGQEFKDLVREGWKT